MAKFNIPKLTGTVKNLLNNLSDYRHYRNITIFSLILSLAFHLTTIISMFFSSLAAGVHIDFIYWVLIVPLVSFLIMIPISANGLGVQEGTFFLYLQKLGVDSTSALLVALLPRIGMFLFSLVGGLLYLYEMNKASSKLAELRGTDTGRRSEAPFST
jgi:uncharacterized membrane protein YbhN (UPF0104 family)